MPVTSSAHLYNARQADQQRAAPGGARQRPGRTLEAADRGAWSVTATFPPQPRNVGRARQLTCTALAAWGAADLVDSAQLVVSELVTNAVRYGRGAISITLALTDAALQISVADFGRELPQAREAGEEDSSGRGLAIVTMLCEEWSVTTRLTGKTVSCWLDLS
ncbi:ATP-binding protein [Saccharothrix sp. ST-888]|uniref:ATP-binding protein n=1 Tax=Saccharothrix sp. ST-888 TaxID=1427391 RepID=UPI0006979DF2|nr:ATP-binding protein [Saccharothrix sp. ST-888]